MSFLASKPTAAVQFVYREDVIDAHTINNLADHLEEHLDRQGYRVDMAVTEGEWWDGDDEHPDEEVEDFLVDMDADENGHHLARRTLVDLLTAHHKGLIEGVFGFDNPDHPLYHEEYAPNVSVAQAREDMLVREARFEAYRVRGGA